MSASRLKFYLVVIWGTIAVLGGGLVLWTLTSPEAQSVIGMAAAGPETITPTPSPSEATRPGPVPSPTPVPTRQIIRATRRPGTEIPAFVTNTPGTPLAIGPLNNYLPPGFDPLTGL